MKRLLPACLILASFLGVLVPWHAAGDTPAIAGGLNIVEGQVVLPEIAHLFNLPCTALDTALGTK